MTKTSRGGDAVSIEERPRGGGHVHIFHQIWHNVGSSLMAELWQFKVKTNLKIAHEIGSD